MMRGRLILLLLLAAAAPLHAEEAVFVPEVPVVNPSAPPPEDDAKPVLLLSAEEPEAAETLKPAREPLLKGERVALAARSDDDLVLVDVMADGALLAESMPGYVSKNTLVLPLGQLAEALEFPIKVSAREGVADGWFYSEENSFSLDIARREATVKGDRETVDATGAEPHEDDIYVDTALLARWFSLQFNFSFATQTVTIAPARGVMLPFQVSAAREKRKAGLAGGQSKAVEYPTVRAPYALYGLPFMDVSATAGFDQRHSQAQKVGVSTLSAGDVLYMHSDLFTTYDERGTSDIRWTLSRRDPDGTLFSDDEAIRHTWLGETADALKLREVALGDIYSPQLPLTARNQSGRGAVISNQPADRLTQFDRTSLEGTILPGWEVELYRNDELLSFQRAADNGRYEFVDVPLLSGLNILRLVFYGPYGETREEVRRVLASAEIAKPGQAYFRLGALQQDDSLLPVRDRLGASLAGASEQERVQGKARAFLEYEQGVWDGVALFGQLVHLPTGDGESRNYATGGIGASVLGVYGRVDASAQAEGGHALQATAQTNLYGATLSGQHQRFDGFLSDFTESVQEPLERRTEARADTPLKLPLLPRVYLGVSGTRLDYVSGRTRDEIGQRLSTSLFGLMSLSNNLRWQTDKAATGARTRQTEGDLTLSLPVARVLLRGSTRYRVKPEGRLENIALTADHAIDAALSLRGEVTRQFATEPLTGYALGVNRRFEQFQLGVSGGYDSQSNLAAFLNVTFSFGFDERADRWRFLPEHTARDGMVSALAYLDRDNDSAYGAGDVPVEAASFRSDSGGFGITDEHGIALLHGLRTENKSNVTLEEESLSNPYWVAKDRGYSVVTRPGVPVALDFAVTESGEVDGTVYLAEKKGGRTVASNVILQLVNEEGEVMRETRSTFDGYYLFDKVAIGRYALRVSPEQLKRRNLAAFSSLAVEIKGEESVLTHRDILLKRLP